MHGARHASIALASFVGGAFLATHHPLAPGLAAMAFVVWCAAATRLAGAWLFVLPACLPAMSFAPWTGWILFDEFDIAALGALVGAHARLALQPPAAVELRDARPLRRATMWVAMPCAAVFVVALVRGWHAGAPPLLDGFDGYTTSLNALRVLKGPFYVLLLLPSLRREITSSAEAAAQRFAVGMLLGVVVVVLAAVWERVAYPGAFEFSDAYRTVALFWEMHVGGAAIDGYLAIAMPFVAGAVLAATTPWRWMSAAALALLAEYVCLTTFSRGVYVAATFGVLLTIALWRRNRPDMVVPAWRRRAGWALLAVSLAELVAVIGADSFMMGRIRRSADDFGGRLAHWRHGIELLQGPLEWTLGKGAGRLPAEYARAVPEHEFSGDAQLVGEGARRHLRLLGPMHSQSLAGLYALTQRVRAAEADDYRAEFLAHVAQPTRLAVSVCHMHLLYEDACQRGVVQLRPGPWQRVALPLKGQPLPGAAWVARTAVFALSVLDAGGVVDLDQVSLRSAGGADLLRNGSFSHELAHWFPIASRYFVPWHIDSLSLELLIEQGMAGVAAFALLCVAALRSLVQPRSRGMPLRPVLIASLSSALLLGLVSSVLDVPRVSFLLYLLAFLSIQLGAARVASRSP